MIESIRLAGWTIPESLSKRLGEKAGRQRAMSAEGHLLIILHAVPSDDDFERQPRIFWRSPEGQWRSLTSSIDGRQSLRKHIEEFAKAVESLEESIEKSTNADAFYQVLLKVAPIHRTARNLHATLQQAREMVDDRDIISLRDRAGEVERAAELLHADAKVGLEYAVAKQEEAQTRSSHAIAESGHRLNLLAAVFLPLTAISATLGMNLPSGLESTGAPWLFWLVLLAGLCLGLFLRSLFIRDRAGSPTEPGGKERPVEPRRQPTK